MRHRPTAWTSAYMLDPFLTSRAMNSSSVALCRQDQDPILSSPPQISCSHLQQLALLDQYESYGSQRSAIRGNSLRYLESSPLSSHTSTDNTRFRKPKLNGHGGLRPNSAEVLLCVLGTAPPPLLIAFTTPNFIPILRCNVITLPLENVTSAC
jgi:hypothetical protein